MSKEIVKLWKDKIEENKKKRKREDGEGSGVKKEEEGKDKDIKRVKAEGGSSCRFSIMAHGLSPIPTRLLHEGVNSCDPSRPTRLNVSVPCHTPHRRQLAPF